MFTQQTTSLPIYNSRIAINSKREYIPPFAENHSLLFSNINSRCYFFSGSTLEKTLILMGDIPYWIILPVCEEKAKQILYYIEESARGIESDLLELAEQVKNNLLLSGLIKESLIQDISSWEYQKHIKTITQGNKPLTILTLEVTRRCQLNCSHCYANAGEPRENELQLPVLMNLVDQLPSLGWHSKSGTVAIIGGEPLLRKDVPDLVKYINNRGYFVQLSTNGLLLKSSDIDWLKSSDIQVSISLDGSEHIHDKIRGKGAYKKVISIVEMLLKNKIKTRLSTCIHNLNIKELPHLLNTAINLGVDEFNFQEILLVGRAINHNFSYAPRKIIYRTLFNLASENVLIEELLKKSHFTRVVNQIRQGWRVEYAGIIINPSLYIASNGNVYSCVESLDIPELQLGNIHIEKLSEIYAKTLKSPKFAPRPINKLNQICANCPVRYYCGGDRRGENFAHTGSIESPHIKCHQIADSIVDLMWMIAERPDFLLL